MNFILELSELVYNPYFMLVHLVTSRVYTVYHLIILLWIVLLSLLTFFIKGLPLWMKMNSKKRRPLLLLERTRVINFKSVLPKWIMSQQSSNLWRIAISRSICQVVKVGNPGSGWSTQRISQSASRIPINIIFKVREERGLKVRKNEALIDSLHKS